MAGTPRRLTGVWRRIWYVVASVVLIAPGMLLFSGPAESDLAPLNAVLLLIVLPAVGLWVGYRACVYGQRRSEARAPARTSALPDGSGSAWADSDSTPEQAERLYRQLLLHLRIDQPDGCLLHVYTPDESLVALTDGSPLFVQCYRNDERHGLAPSFVQAVNTGNAPALRLLVVGGGEGVRQALKDLQPTNMVNRRIHIFQLGIDRKLWSGPYSSPGDALQSAVDGLWAQGEPASIPDGRWVEIVETAVARARQVGRELDAFRSTLSARGVPATWGLAGAVVVLFLLEMLWGGAESIPTLVRMGAIIRDPERAAEHWRLLAAGFLHGGVMHVFFNTSVLVSLGSLVERLLGTARMLVLYTASIVGGGLAAQWFSDAGVVVGASTGIWGLMAGAAMLSLKPRGLVPERIAAMMRRQLWSSLGINALVSFLPNISLAGHAGGGIVGAALVGTGLLTLGTTPIEARATDASVVTGPRREPTSMGPGMARLAAALCVLLMAGSIGMAFSEGQPWILVGTPEWRAQRLEGTPVQLELPAMLEPNPVRAEVGAESRVFIFGDLMRDPAMIEIRYVPGDVSLERPEDRRAMRDMLRQTLGQALGDTFKPAGAAMDGDQDGDATVEQHFSAENGFEIVRYIRVMTSGILSVSLYARPDTRQSPAGWTDRIAKSVRVAAAAANPTPPD